MTPRLIVTGYGGFVAGSVVWQALGSGQWDVYALSLTEPPEERDGFRCIQFDLCDASALAGVVERVRPQAIIHTAAIADIDFCQSHPREANRVNAEVTSELSRQCAKYGGKLILCSTDSVFDGKKGMYREEDEPHAINFYAHTKLHAEAAVREAAPDNVIVRLSLVMGLPVLGSGNSFLAKMVTTLEKGQPVTFPENEVRTPVDVITVGRALLELADSGFSGTLHLAGNTRLNRYQMACQLAERMGYGRDLVVATDSNAIEGRAPRPNDASLDNSKAQRILATPMRSLMDGLQLVLEAKETQRSEQS